MTEDRAGRSGRPRADGYVSANPRDEIIAVGTRLFAEIGYASTTMTRIAEESGLRQASLYYWFRSKEELLRATAVVNRASVEVAEALDLVSAPVEVKLYRLLHDDTLFVCNGPCDYNEIERLAAQRPDDFAMFWSDYHALFRSVRTLIADGVASRAFGTSVDPDQAAASALAINEGQQKLFRLARTGAAHYLPVPALPLAAYARQAADTTLAVLLADRRSLDGVRDQAMRLVPDPDVGPAPVSGQKNSR